ncbi:MAG: PP2C family protein-serine/threonine phosphatase [Spirochaetaceae bacterium]
MRLEVYAASNVGLHRSHNEDMALVGTHRVRDDVYNGVHEVSSLSGPYVLAVADGLGGQNAGEVASRSVIETFNDRVGALDGRLSTSALTTRLSELSEEIHRELVKDGTRNARREGMSTTLTAVVVYEQQFFLLHAGDSRCYVLRNGVLRRVTRDHTLREFTGNASIPGNILVNCFGSQNDFFVDVRPFTSEGDAGDVFVLCSDGLTDMVAEPRMESLLRDTEELDAAGAGLLEEALAAGGNDNVTFVLARVL